MIVARQQRGLTLVEVLVAVIILAVVMIPAISALQTGAVGSAVHADVTSSHHRVSARLEQLLAEPFADLSAAAIAAGGPGIASSYSDALGPPARLVVFLSHYDGDNADADNDPFTGTDAGLMWIRVDIEGSVHTLQTIKAQGF